MLALALSVVLLSPQDVPRLRTICRNGTAIIVENVPDESSISVQLWASATGVPETPETHGHRHLLEHLAARGSGDLDHRLERQGCFLRARTFRDAMQFEVNVGPRQLEVGLSALQEIIKPLAIDASAIQREVKVMSEEFATYDDASKLSAGAWIQAFGNGGLDPFGKIESIGRATPEGLRELHRRQCYPENLVISISGPVDVKNATERAVEAFGMKQGGVRVVPANRIAASSGRLEIDGFGEARAAETPGYDHPLTVGALAFALAIASEVEGAFVTYTPSVRPGLVIVGQTERVSGIGIKIDSVKPEEWPRLFQVGRILVQRWIDRYLHSSTGISYLRGLLMVQSAAARPEAMSAAIATLTYEQFKSAAAKFSPETGITVVGT